MTCGSLGMVLHQVQQLVSTWILISKTGHWVRQAGIIITILLLINSLSTFRMGILSLVVLGQSGVQLYSLFQFLSK